jgi:AP endonuclease-1
MNTPESVLDTAQTNKQRVSDSAFPTNQKSKIFGSYYKQTLSTMSTSLTKKVVGTLVRAASPTLTRTATLVVDNDISEPARKRLKRSDTSATSILAGEESQLALESIGTNVFIDEPYSQTLVETQKSTADVSSGTKTKGNRGGRAQKASASPTDFPPRSDLEWKIGAHISAAGGVEESIINAAKIGFVVTSMAFGDY